MLKQNDENFDKAALFKYLAALGTDSQLLRAVLKTLEKMHGRPLPAVLCLMLSELFYKQDSGDICIKSDADSVAEFYRQRLSILKDNQQNSFKTAYSESETLEIEKLIDSISSSSVKDAVDSCSELIGRSDQDSLPLIYDLGRLYIRRNYCYEKAIADYVGRAGSDCSTLVNISDETCTEIRSMLDALFGAEREKTSDSRINMQKLAAAMAAVSHFCIITGGPGTGKTTTVARLLLILQNLYPSRSRIMLCAPTGKAAGRMTASIRSQFTEDSELYKLALNIIPDSDKRERIIASICKTAVTVDKLLGSIPHKAQKIHNKNNKLDCDILIVDEVSMVDASNFAKLCDCIRDETKVIMLGDKDQLASVEAGAVLNDLCHELDEHSSERNEEKLRVLSEVSGYSVSELKNARLTDYVVQLDYSYRFAKYKGIGAIASAVNEANKDTSAEELLKPFSVYEDELELLPVDGALTYREQLKIIDELCSINSCKSISKDYESFWDALVSAHMKGDKFAGISAADAENIFKKLDEYRILCANRDGVFGVANINSHLEKIARNRLEALNIQTGSIDDDWFIGKVVLVTRNNYALKISNGDVGFVAAERKADGTAGPLRIWFTGSSGIFNISPAFLVDYESGYAMTIHKSQGSEYKRVCMLLSGVLNPIMTKELVYTGITRTVSHVTILSDEQVFVSACRKKVARESGLVERI